MKTLVKIILPLLLLGATPAFAQYVISAPVAEGMSRQQVVHQGITDAQMGTAKGLAAQMKKVNNQITGITDKTKVLHETWFNSLLAISSGVRNYRRVKEIYDAQTSMISQYSRILPKLRTQGLTSAQITSATTVYGGILQENIGLISELVDVLSANRAKMTDPERLEFINNVADRMVAQQELMSFVTSKCTALAAQQRQVIVDRNSVLALMGAPASK